MATIPGTQDLSQFVTGSTVGGLRIQSNPNDRSGLNVQSGALKLRPRTTRSTNPNAQLESEIQSLLDRFDALDAANRRVQAPNLDVGALNRRALETAKTKVNPFFDEERRLFLEDIQRRRGEAQKDAQLLTEETDLLLQEFLEDTDITRTRTSEDVEGNLDELGLSEDLFQTQEAEQADADRTTVADEIAEAGLTTSGLGRQKVAELQKKRAAGSKEAVRQFDKKKQEQIKFRTRTFEDIEKGEKRKVAQTAREKKAIKFQLDKQLGSFAFEKITKERRNEVERKRELERQQRSVASDLFAGFLDTLGAPQREAAEAAFGGRF